MAIRPKPTADRRQSATPRPWVLEVALVTAAVGAIAESQDADRANDGHDREEREHAYIIGHLFSPL
jgi:hypothetical protein